MTVALMCAGVVPVFGQTGPFIEVAGNFSPVTIGGTEITWHAARLALGVQRDGQFGWMATSDRHQRGQLFDVSFGASGFRRMGDWTIFGAGGFVSNPHFLYRRSLEGELSRRLVGTVVGHAGYRYLEFPGSDVSIIQPGASWYLPRGELITRVFLVRNLTSHENNATVLVRGAVDTTSRLRVTGGVSRGSRIFDVSAVSGSNADAWVAFGSVQFAVTPQWGVEVGVGGAHEDPFFDQRTVSLRIRSTF